MIEQEVQIESPAVAGPQKKSSRGQSKTWRGLLLVLLAGAAVLGYAIYIGITSRAQADASLERETSSLAIPTVSVIHPAVTAGSEEVVLPGNVQAFKDTPIWARSSGYLKAWLVDIGARVKRGQLLAEIEAPEVEQQLTQARAQLNTDEANLKLSQITAERYMNLFKTDSVSKQDVDNAVQNQAARAATVNSSQANVSRLEQLVGYEKIYAPFDGVITARNIDVGALVDAGANTPGKELFHLASTSTLRVYVNVPEAYSRVVRPGVNASLTLNEFPGQQFSGNVVRDADAIDMASRTLLVEVDVSNPTGRLLPGSYASVHIKVPGKVAAVTVPSNVLLFRSEGLRAAVVRDNRTALVPIILGRDYGDSVEIVSGLTQQDQVIVNPSDSIVPGQQVQVADKSGATAGSD